MLIRMNTVFESMGQAQLIEEASKSIQAQPRLPLLNQQIIHKPEISLKKRLNKHIHIATGMLLIDNFLYFYNLKIAKMPGKEQDKKLAVCLCLRGH